MSGSPEAVWRAALAEGRLLLQRAKASGAHFFPPRLAEPRTGDEDWTWEEASGFGTVYSVTVVNQRPPVAPYDVALIDLDEGPRLMSRVEGMAAEAITIGQRVRARIDLGGDAPILLFDPA